MKLNVFSIDHLRIEVPHVIEAVNWCNNIFNFETYMLSSHYAIIGNKYLKFCLSQSASYDKHPNELSEYTPQILHFGLHIDNWDKVIDKLKAMGEKDIYTFKWENNAESIYIYGPLGEIELTKIAGGNLKVEHDEIKEDEIEEQKTNKSESTFSLDEDF